MRFGESLILTKRGNCGEKQSGAKQWQMLMGDRWRGLDTESVEMGLTMSSTRKETGKPRLYGYWNENGNRDEVGLVTVQRA
jgi:hypothetical protein